MATTGRCSIPSMSPMPAPQRTRGVYEAQKNRAGVDYQWSSPLFLSRAGVNADVRNEDPVHRSEAADRHGLCRDHVLGKVALKDQSWVTLKVHCRPHGFRRTGFSFTSIRPGGPRHDSRARRADQRFQMGLDRAGRYLRNRLTAVVASCPARCPAALSFRSVHDCFRQRSGIQRAFLDARSPDPARRRRHRARPDRGRTSSAVQTVSRVSSPCSSASVW